MIFAQISDLHVQEPGKLMQGRVDTEKALHHCVEALNQLDPQPDFVLVTGDLTNDAQPEEYAQFRKLIEPLRAPFYVIPGNHDDRDEMRAILPDHDYLRQMDPFIQYTIEGFPLRFIGLDTLVPGKGYGELCEPRLAWLDARLSEAPDRPTVLFLHHPPFLTGMRVMDSINCRSGDALAAVLARHPQVIRLLCGHVHRGVHTMFHGVEASIGPSPTHALMLDVRKRGSLGFILEPPGFHLHIWEPEMGLVTHVGFMGVFEEKILYDPNKAASNAAPPEPAKSPEPSPVA